MGRGRNILMVLTAVTASGQAVGQSQLPAGTQRVEPGVGDVGALPGVGRVDMSRDLRHDRGFGTVYRLDVPTRMGMPGATTPMMFRRDGGVTAVFPESVYTATDWGLIPEVPPGTTFYIGELPPSLLGAGPAPRSALYVDLRAPTGVPEPRIAPVPVQQGQPMPASQSIWLDEGYRQRSLGRLVEIARKGQ